jgi:uncharacterized protein
LTRHLISALMLIASTAAAGVEAQQPPEASIIRTAGNGVVELPADYAVLLIGVRVEGDRPDSVAREMGARVDRIVNALVGIGVSRDSLPTSRLALNTRPRTVQGTVEVRYEASTDLRLRVWDLDRLPMLLEAAVEAGATDIPHLQFRSLRENEGREEAVRLATEEANRHARIMAAAQGLSLDRLISSSFDPPVIGFDRILLRGAASMASSTLIPATIVPVGISISARVSVEWEAH